MADAPKTEAAKPAVSSTAPTSSAQKKNEAPKPSAGGKST